MLIRPLRHGLTAWLALAATHALIAQAPTDSTPAAPQATSRTEAAPRPARPLPYGSDLTFNPLSQTINDGFNNLDLYTRDPRLRAQPWHESFRNIGRSLQHIESSYRRYGWSKAWHNELLPLTGRTNGGQWLPNYQDHLFGSGMVSTRMVDWFRARNVPHPVLMGYLAMTASHLLNETIERPNARSVDALTDLVVFDNLGFLLFNATSARRVVERHIEFNNWIGQPVITAPDWGVENASENFVVRSLARPDTRWRFIYYWGVTHLVGVSRRLPGERWLSVGAGAGAGSVTVQDTANDARTIELKPRAGIFLDEDGSLLASLVWLGNSRDLASLNIYPGVLPSHREWPGLYIGLQRRRLSLGITSALGLGIGH